MNEQQFADKELLMDIVFNKGFLHTNTDNKREVIVPLKKVTNSENGTNSSQCSKTKSGHRVLLNTQNKNIED